MINLRRPMNFIDKKYMYHFYGQKFTFENISYFKVKKLYRLEGEKLTRNFFHHLITDWIEKSYQESEKFLANLKKYIRKAKLILNDLEQDQILTMEERIFSKIRHIKMLMVNIELSKGEHAGAKFTNAYLYKNNDFLASGNIIFTNFRIIFQSQKNYEFYYDKVQAIDGLATGLLIRENDDYLLQIHDQITLANTFYNLYSKKVAKK